MIGEIQNKWAVWTPELESVNGQNSVTHRVLCYNAKNFQLIYTYPRGGWLAIAKTLFMSLHLFISVIFGKTTSVYIVCSRSTAGFFRDFIPLLCSKIGARVLVHVHGTDFLDLLQNRHVSTIARWSYSSCDIIVPSKHLVDLLASFDFKKLVCCENFSDFPEVGASCDVPFSNDELTVLWNSNIMSSKGFVELVEAARAFRKDGGAIKLVVLGQPLGDVERSKSDMQEFLHTLGHEEWVELKGLTRRENVYKYVCESDVVALPSNYPSECQPLAVIEAMLAGRMLLVSDTPALRATVGNYPAVFVEKNVYSVLDGLRLLCTLRYIPSTDAVLQARVRFSTELFDFRINSIFCDTDGLKSWW